jgi:hypothetical protein
VTTRGKRAVRITLALLLALVVLLGMSTCALPRPGIPDVAAVPADARTVTVVASDRYRAGPVHRFWMGGGYRDVWAAPVRVEVLDPRRSGGGLVPLRRSGGRQTRGLRLRGGDGHVYVFRSVDKDPAGALGGVERVLMGRVRQDQVGALHPAAALVAGGLQDAAGIPNAPARLAVMPGTGLGPFRADFEGLLGTIQEYPGKGFAGIPRVLDTEELWPELRRVPTDRVDARAYLAARLMDVYLGDWDRHEGQLVWGRVERGGRGEWVVIPRDRDYAFSDYRGVIPGLARRVDAKIVRFDGEYRDLKGLLVKARPLDRRLLCALAPAAWDSAAAALSAALTDSAITASIARMPREYVARSAPLAATLRARRDALPSAARRFRQHLHASGGCTARQ